MARFIHTQTSKFNNFRRRHRTHQLRIPAVSVENNPLHILWQYQILDPDSDIVYYWNHVFLITSIVSLFIDPLYFFLPYVLPTDNICFTNDRGLAVLITYFRSIGDLFFCLHIAMKFRTAFVAPSSRVFGRGELVMDAQEIAQRYIRSDFLIDIAAALPLPQIVIWFVVPATKNNSTDHANSTLSLIVLIQYIPRLFVIFPLHSRINKSTGFIAKTAWAGAAYNLVLYILASHTLGASWYLLSLNRQFYCWKSECSKENQSGKLGCIHGFLDCSNLGRIERQIWRNVTDIPVICSPYNANTTFKFGIFADAFTNYVASTTFVEKYLYCLWWGLRNLSSYAQTLETSIFLGENVFCAFICILGLVLSAQLIGNMQTNLQSMSVRVEEWRIKRRDTEEWMRHRQLPEDLQERVRRSVQHKWLATRGVHEESILRSLPLDLRRGIQRHLCLALVRRVPFFSQMDDQLLDAICERLVSSLCTEGTYLFQEGDPVNEMLFIIRGQLESSTTNGGRAGFFNCITLRPGEFCGEELLTWALMPQSTANLPTSTRTVKAISEVEAFALQADDLYFVAHQFKRLQSKKLQHAFRYYSQQWRTWGTCLIQSGWRRYKKRKLAKELASQNDFGYFTVSEEEYDFQDAMADNKDDEETGQRSATDGGNNVQHLGATILASKFAANTKKGNQQKDQAAGSASASSSLKMPQLFKPNEPDFFAD
ncbi:Cyclic nucleotide-gated ion channel 18 [Turnera subulata]|uniref:Cyclic nucleotide-gated ion channel 18 n=1 Tax=Turnera subulata TaxID=218843 RepID=A0A9Q0GKY5_9ROSI|nr:Cyclic nucleotide-gated ion channel 18 [Turnera subulata]